MSADQTVYDVFDTLTYGSDWWSALLTVMLLSFIWNLFYLIHSIFSFQVLQERVEALQRQLHAVEKKLMRRELEYQEQVKLQMAWTSMYATSPGGPGRSHILSLICPTHILHIPWDPASRALGQECCPVSEGFINNNRSLWPWVKVKRERELISWLIAPVGLWTCCVCRNALFVLENWWPLLGSSSYT